ncbi:MAG: hypothetical protein JWL69_99, partial [Phycisphaerales bacterium]|nr:hypothetical protein [Phycisphaerales bacterium]
MLPITLSGCPAYRRAKVVKSESHAEVTARLSSASDIFDCRHNGVWRRKAPRLTNLYTAATLNVVSWFQTPT